MTRFSTERLRRLDLAELAWRGRAAADIARGRLTSTLRRPAWNRHELAGALGPGSAVAPVAAALRNHDWMRAHAALMTHYHERPARFVIAPAMREAVSASITARFPESARDAAARANRMIDGRYDVLGYRDLPFDGRDWHRDAVHDKTAPRIFWSQVSYLDPSCGDHKVIWEINRHQHWMAFGRAYWLTGDERYRDECLTQLDGWMTDNPPLIGINWASALELGFRAISWIWALNFFSLPGHNDPTPWSVDLLLGLDRQLTHIERHLSYYFSPNTHLLGEALALYVSGRAVPELAASPRREATGRRILSQEIARQVMADGGHCERSAHYHRYTLDFYLLALAVARLTDDPIADTFERACVRLAEAARILADDTGRLPHIGDDDGGTLFPIARRAVDDARDSLAVAAALTGRPDLLIGEIPEEAWWLLAHERFADSMLPLERPAPPVAARSSGLPATGYYISRRDGDHLIVDAGPHGYMNGGHAHADALSLTFTRRGRPLLIDTGTGCYTVDARTRDRFRSTPLHNTLTLNAQSQSIPRGPFHWQHVANGSTRRWHTTRRFDYFAGTHDGYLPLVHARHVLMLHGDVLVVADCVANHAPAAHGLKAAQPEVSAAVHWHLDPAWAAAMQPRGAVLQAGGESVELAIAGGAIAHFHGDHATGLGWHAPVYGYTEPTSTVRITRAGTVPFWIVSVFGLDSANTIHAVDFEPLPTGNGLQFAATIRIDRVCSTDRLVVAEPVDGARDRRWQTEGLESDAAMVFTRTVGATASTIALVDATMLRLDHEARMRTEQREGPECAELPDSLMARQ